MSDLEERVEKMQADIDSMMVQIDELYDLVKTAGNPFGAFLTGTTPRYRRKKEE